MLPTIQFLGASMKKNLPLLLLSLGLPIFAQVNPSTNFLQNSKLSKKFGIINGSTIAMAPGINTNGERYNIINTRITVLPHTSFNSTKMFNMLGLTVDFDESKSSMLKDTSSSTYQNSNIKLEAGHAFQKGDYLEFLTCNIGRASQYENVTQNNVELNTSANGFSGGIRYYMINTRTGEQVEFSGQLGNALDMKLSGQFPMLKSKDNLFYLGGNLAVNRSPNGKSYITLTFTPSLQAYRFKFGPYIGLTNTKDYGGNINNSCTAGITIGYGLTTKPN
jgi:hypothetical protein